MSSAIEGGLISRKELKSLIPYDPSYLAKLEKQGLFPRRVHLGPGKLGYVRSEIIAWLENKIAERNWIEQRANPAREHSH
jgi:prophage regulatory protein